MAYRAATAAEERWTAPREHIREATLPPSCHKAFEAFEKLFDYRGVMSLPEEQRPTFIELPAEGSPEVYFPQYDQVKPSLLTSLAGSGCMTVLILVVVGVLVGIVDAITVSGVATNVLWGIGGAAVLAAHVWWWWSEWRDLKRIRNHPRSMAFGTFLLGDAVVQRYVSRCHYYPRECIREIHEDIIPEKGPSEYTPYLRYVDRRGKVRKTSLGLAQFDVPEGDATQRVQRWFRETQPAESE